ncbi:MAG: alkaline phosphatase, partial [Bacteroidota bacterium]
GNTFAALYLDPLGGLAERNELRPLQLLIDLKSEAYATLDKVIGTIENYPKLTQDEHLKFVISGNRPAPVDYGNYPAFIYFDHQSLLDLATTDLSKVAMISQNFRAYSRWNGYGRMTARDSIRVSTAVQRAQKTNKPFRFWATPDTKTAWACFAKLGVGYVNTDHPARARQFLDKLDQNSYGPQTPVPTYVPRFAFARAGRPRNIILMIGDGNGLAQISAALLANRGQLSLAKIKHVGLVNTAAADDAVTDSAAAGTAMATGVKTDNRAIGVDPSGQARPTLIEILSSRGYRTGIITTDAIDGATPAAFYAHTSERDDTDKIIADLRRSEVDFFVAGKKLNAAELQEKFTTKTLDQLTDLRQPTAIYNGEGKMPAMVDGRGDYLPRSVRKVLRVLAEEDAPFFLLVEGAQIDNGGHGNDITTIVIGHR